jgi:uncharacterized lipoprotein YddW (UPF0748 family)
MHRLLFETTARRARPRRLAWLLTAALLAVATALSPARGADDPAVIDSCVYADDAAAAAAWQPMFGSPPAATATTDGVKALRMRCPFSTTRIERASWDRSVRLDLTASRALRFRFLCRDVAPISYFMVYLQSGDGWYTKEFYPETTGWNTITIEKAGMGIEGAPAGWGKIRTIRVSAWRGGNTDTEFALSDLRKVGQLGVDTLVALVRADSVVRERPEERRSVEQFTRTVADTLEKAGIGYATLSDADLSADTLRLARLVILPYNPTMPDRALDLLIARIHSGGRLIAFYGMPGRLRPVVRIDAAGYRKPDSPGEFSEMRFIAGAVPGAPAVVGQKSWNINEPKPVPGASKMVAEWYDKDGRATGHAAVVASSNAIEVSHVLLPDDPSNKRLMLMAMAGQLVPQTARLVSNESLARLGQFAGFHGFDDAMSRIAEVGNGRTSPDVRSALTEVKRHRDTAVALIASGRFTEASGRVSEAERRLLDAFCLAQQPLAGEFRAFWCHSAFGVDGMSWDAAAQRLADNGFTAVLPNMLWGGVAYYDSKVLPVAPEVATRGDQIAQCVAACKKHGLQVHVWKVNWNLGNAPESFVQRLRREHRLQSGTRGEELRWLCPSNPVNQQLEIDAMVEVAQRYDVDGIHFDYIRYPDGDHCFCSGCKERFQKAIGADVARWPRDVLDGGPHRRAFLDWRQGNITTVVQGVSAQVRPLKPKLRLSAAVFRNWPVDRDGVGQDWKLWCDRGYLDFVCPMDYTASNAQFDNWVKHQKEWAGKAACYPGIGSFIMPPDRVIEQILTTRRHSTHGFTVFNYDAGAARTLLPLLGEGITRKPSVDSPAR